MCFILLIRAQKSSSVNMLNLLAAISIRNDHFIKSFDVLFIERRL